VIDLRGAARHRRAPAARSALRQRLVGVRRQPGRAGAGRRRTPLGADHHQAFALGRLRGLAGAVVANAAVCRRVDVFLVAPGQRSRQRKSAAGGGATGWRSASGGRHVRSPRHRAPREGERAGGTAEPIRLAAHHPVCARRSRSARAAAAPGVRLMAVLVGGDGERVAGLVRVDALGRRVEEGAAPLKLEAVEPPVRDGSPTIRPMTPEERKKYLKPAPVGRAHRCRAGSGAPQLELRLPPRSRPRGACWGMATATGAVEWFSGDKGFGCIKPRRAAKTLSSTSAASSARAMTRSLKAPGLLRLGPECLGARLIEVEANTAPRQVSCTACATTRRSRTTWVASRTISTFASSRRLGWLSSSGSGPPEGTRPFVIGPVPGPGQSFV